MVNLVCSGQAIYYAVRERRRIWSSKPSAIVLACSLADLLIVPMMAYAGILMAPLSLRTILSLFGAAVALPSCWTQRRRAFSGHSTWSSALASALRRRAMSKRICAVAVSDPKRFE